MGVATQQHVVDRTASIWADHAAPTQPLKVSTHHPSGGAPARTSRACGSARCAGGRSCSTP
eukprot:6289960-Alexandrium_andersonii.AAC.1